MKIELKKGFMAVLTEENGDVIGLLASTPDARLALETAVSEHFTCDCTLCDDRDFTQPLDYEQPYQFRLYAEGCENEYVALTLSYAPIY
jgi:hypothetical protein